MAMFNDVKGFRFWCQKVLPLVYDDSLSYYELLCKVVKYYNDLKDVVNSHSELLEVHENRLNEIDVNIEEIKNELIELGMKIDREVTRLEELIERTRQELVEIINALRQYVDNNFYTKLEISFDGIPSLVITEDKENKFRINVNDGNINLSTNNDMGVVLDSANGVDIKSGNEEDITINSAKDLIIKTEEEFNVNSNNTITLTSNNDNVDINAENENVNISGNYVGIKATESFTTDVKNVIATATSSIVEITPVKIENVNGNSIEDVKGSKNITSYDYNVNGTYGAKIESDYGNINLKNNTGNISIETGKNTSGQRVDIDAPVIKLNAMGFDNSTVDVIAKEHVKLVSTSTNVGDGIQLYSNNHATIDGTQIDIRTLHGSDGNINITPSGNGSTVVKNLETTSIHSNTGLKIDAVNNVVVGGNNANISIDNSDSVVSLNAQNGATINGGDGITFNGVKNDLLASGEMNLKVSDGDLTESANNIYLTSEYELGSINLNTNADECSIEISTESTNSNINITTYDEGSSIVLTSDDEMSLTSEYNMGIKSTSASIDISAENDITIKSNDEIHIKSENSDVDIISDNNINMSCTEDLFINGNTGTIQIKGNMLLKTNEDNIDFDSAEDLFISSRNGNVEIISNNNDVYITSRNGVVNITTSNNDNLTKNELIIPGYTYIEMSTAFRTDTDGNIINGLDELLKVARAISESKFSIISICCGEFSDQENTSYGVGCGVLLNNAFPYMSKEVTIQTSNQNDRGDCVELYLSNNGNSFYVIFRKPFEDYAYGSIALININTGTLRATCDLYNADEIRLKAYCFN